MLHWLCQADVSTGEAQSPRVLAHAATQPGSPASESASQPASQPRPSPVGDLAAAQHQHLVASGQELALVGDQQAGGACSTAGPQWYMQYRSARCAPLQGACHILGPK